MLPYFHNSNNDKLEAVADATPAEDDEEEEKADAEAEDEGGKSILKKHSIENCEQDNLGWSSI